MSSAAAAVRELIRKSRVGRRRIEAVGVMVSGITDIARGVVRYSAALGWDEPVELAPILARATGLPVFVENDAKLFALAEHRFGAAKGKQHVAGITIGTGIGCGLIINGIVYRGASGGAGEWGHVPYKNTDYEGYAAGVVGMERLYTALTGKKLLSADIITGSDAVSSAVREEAYDALARLLASIINSLNPEMIVLGGGVSKSLPLADIRKRSKGYSIADNYAHCTIVKYAIADSSGSIGAAVLALESLKK
jgi:predicted NBD/HSP70 family sugar kinase